MLAFPASKRASASRGLSSLARRRLARASSPAQAGEGLLVATLAHQHEAHTVVRFGEVRLELGGLAIGVHRRRGIAAVAIGAAEVVVRPRAIGRELGRAAQQRDGLLELPALRELAAQPKARVGRIRRRCLGAEQPLQHARVPSTQVTAWPPR
jgi:hypothetical protein